MTQKNQTATTYDQITGKIIRYRVRDGWVFDGVVWHVDTESAKWHQRRADVEAQCTQDTADLDDWMLNSGGDPYTLSPRTIARQYDEQARQWAEEARP